ncbi:MAG: acyl-CoA dehydrogenase family protein [Gammaproteobacteria bacterium]
MDFDFSDEQYLLRDHARRFLDERCGSARVHRILDGAEPFDSALWRELAELGWCGTAIPAEYGGQGAGYLELCLLAEELGRVVAPVPFASSIYLAAELLLLAGSPAQRHARLPVLASGDRIGTFALASVRAPAASGVRAQRGRLTGSVLPVPDGDIADFAIVCAHDADAGASLYLVDTAQPGVGREALASIDPTRSQARLTFAGAEAEPLGAPGAASTLADAVCDRAAALIAFEQIGGAQRVLETASEYAKQRYAFGRPIGSFQAIKHMLADMFVEVELARSNCYYGAWALAGAAPELAQAAAMAHIGASSAFLHCARQAVQIHGGIGFTWEMDCHLYFRRANLLARALGNTRYWKSRLVDVLDRTGTI